MQFTEKQTTDNQEKEAAKRSIPPTLTKPNLTPSFSEKNEEAWKINKKSN